ncbi:hypothetical protein ACFL0Q_00730 [Thermodesulfobacteriota bacterium]
MKITRFEDLECWQQAREMTRLVYNAAKDSTFKKDLRLSGKYRLPPHPSWRT